MFFYLIFVGALAAADAIGNVTVTKDKRQVEQPTHSFVPSNHQIGGQHHYAASGEQITATPQNYYRYVQNLLQNQQQPQQYQDSPKEIPSHQSEPRHHAQPIKPAQFVYYNEPQAQYQPAVDNHHQLEPKVISEEEYLELVRQQYGENVNHTAAPKHRANKASQYKAQKDYQQTYIPNEQPQSYLKSYVNPLGEFSLEKELAQLEKSNKAIYEEQAEKDTEQSLKKERYQFKPSHQFVEYQDQQDQFLPPAYSHLSGNRPVSQKLISSPYERDESAAEKANNHQPDYQFRFVSPTDNSAKFYQETIKTGPKNSFVPLPKPQHLDASDSAAHSNANIAKKHSQLIYQKQHTSASTAQHNPPNKKQPQKVTGPNSEKFSQYQPNKAQSQSSIFVSQSTGIQQKPQVENEQPTQDNIQQHQQAQQLYHNHQQLPQQQHNPRIPLTNPNRPLTQEEFQALVDAGYKVQAIPIPVPVPVSAEAYAQHQQQQQNLQQQQQQQQLQQQQQQPHQPHHQQQYQQPNPYHPQQSVNPTRSSSIRPQPSNKHYIRYHPQPTEGVLTSYLRPFLEQYNNLMGGKI
ncbi:putative mediator of RNA polymerase II transcription subunit 12 [Bradysia coprophila]|uniref:putative mediator of RNA polymerase II transcription subunit 12 n=1 Tax=Bradysia coprophila TaxID=38358 RepID=UPI00187D738D|nr:putative mediator of RNA polymerase II transcription subunit 12 [Bradysia coprophila]